MVSYTYTAGGQKLRMSTSTGEVRDYIGPFQYLNSAPFEVTHEEGRVLPGSPNGYEYFLRDHLGNVRAVVANVNGAFVTQMVDYDPWGLELSGLGSGLSNNRAKFNGKETLAELGSGLLDFGARGYDATIGRWGVVDPLAEVSRRFSPFVYGNNNPVRFIDPDGMESQDTKTTTEYTYSNGYSTESSRNSTASIGYEGVGVFVERDGKSSNSGQSQGDPPGKGQKAVSEKSTTNLTSEKGGNNVIAAGITLSTALAADDATVIGIADDPLIPLILAGTGIYAAVQAGLAQKMSDEIDRILQKAAGPQGYAYELRVKNSGVYTDVRGNTVVLNAGDIWKFGKATYNGKERYSDKELGAMVPGGVKQTPIYFGNEVQIRIFEKYLIYGYYFNHNHLPPGNRIFR